MNRGIPVGLMRMHRACKLPKTQTTQDFTLKLTLEHRLSVSLKTSNGTHETSYNLK